MKQVKFEKKMVERTIMVESDLTCDLCGFDEDETMIWPLIIQLNPDSCGQTRIKRDVCQWCYEDTLSELFDNLFVLLKAGDEELTEAHDDIYYG